MEFNLSAGSAAVIATSIAFIWGVILKVFPRKNESQAMASFMKSQEVMMQALTKSMDNHTESIKNQNRSIENQNTLISKIYTTMAMMEKTGNRSHEKLDMISRSVLRIDNIEEKIDELGKLPVKN